MREQREEQDLMPSEDEARVVPPSLVLSLQDKRKTIRDFTYTGRITSSLR